MSAEQSSSRKYKKASVAEAEGGTKDKEQKCRVGVSEDQALQAEQSGLVPP